MSGLLADCIDLHCVNRLESKGERGEDTEHEYRQTNNKSGIDIALITKFLLVSPAAC